MTSATPSFTLPSPPPTEGPSLWSRQSRRIKQGIKTGLAGAIAYTIYAVWNLPEGYWAVFTALVVTQSNLGASWKAALYRTFGSTAGALSAALLVPIVGTGPLRVGIALFILASIFGYLTVQYPGFAAAGFTVAIILVFSTREEPWHLAWLRVMYTVLGSFIAFGVSALIWPVRAREELRLQLANIFEGCGALYNAVTAAATEGAHNAEEIQQLDRRLHDLRRGITQQMEEARSELAFSRFNQIAYQQVVAMADQLRRRLTAMAEDSSLFTRAPVPPELVPALPRLSQRTSEALVALAAFVRKQGQTLNSPDLDLALQDLDLDLARLRDQRTTAPFTLDRMLPFWALVFNLREIAQGLRQIESAVLLLA
jgi:uncharacterized membrane protein YgaE (UPF0421/DUF939 family)